MTARKKHIAIEANTGRFSWSHGDDIGWFRPNGRLYVHSDDDLSRNKRLWSDEEPLFAARIFVGFNVNAEPVWTLDDVVTIVRAVRERQVGNPSSTFLTQRGVYAHTETVPGHDKPLVVDEQGAQIIIVNTSDLKSTPREFQAQMEDLADTLAVELDQESVILEIQRGGLTVKTIGFGRVAEGA